MGNNLLDSMQVLANVVGRFLKALKRCPVRWSRENEQQSYKSLGTSSRFCRIYFY